MPLYEYQCDSCSHRFETIQKFSDPPVGVCPSCGGTVKKLLSSPAIQFKGSGFYITDYARKNGAGAAKTSTEAPSTSSGSESSAAAPASPSTSASSSSTTKAGEKAS
jgi:putative FmdB family regulatory protein